jgi:hypothetical protein
MRNPDRTKKQVHAHPAEIYSQLHHPKQWWRTFRDRCVQIMHDEDQSDGHAARAVQLGDPLWLV